MDAGEGRRWGFMELERSFSLFRFLFISVFEICFAVAVARESKGWVDE